MPKFAQIIFNMYRTRNNNNKTLTCDNIYKGLPRIAPSAVGARKERDWKIVTQSF